MVTSEVKLVVTVLLGKEMVPLSIYNTRAAQPDQQIQSRRPYIVLLVDHTLIPHVEDDGILWFTNQWSALKEETVTNQVIVIVDVGLELVPNNRLSLFG